MTINRQGDLLPMVKFREILRLHEQGHNQSEIARSCFTARSTVQDYIRRAQQTHLSAAHLLKLSDSDLQDVLGKGKRKRSKQKPPIDFESVHRELGRKGVTLSLLWMEGKERGQWQCSYGGFCRRYRQWKRKQSPTMRQVHQGGEKIYVDYCGMTVAITHPITGEVTDAQIFVASFGASNYTFAEATASQSLAHWIGSHQRALAFFGGVPKAIVPDNLKSGVTDPCRYEPGINRSYQDFAEHYNVIILPARPKAPRDKAKVENAVQQVERQILAPLRDESFSSLAQLNKALKQGGAKLNARTMRSYGQSRRERFEQVDQPQLSPLPTQGFEFAHWKTAKINLDYHIEVDRHYYSVPYEYVRQSVTVKITESLVQVFHNHQQIACHERSKVRFQHSTQEGHMPPEHYEYKTQSRDKFLAWASQIGPATTEQVKAIFAKKTYDEQAFRTLKGVQHLNTTYGSERLEAACQRANVLAMVGKKHLSSILKHKLESEPLLEETPTVVPIHHANVRGQTYYQAN